MIRLLSLAALACALWTPGRAAAPATPPEEQLFELLTEAIGRVDVRRQGCEAVATSLEAFVAERRARIAELRAAAEARFREADGKGRRAILGRLDALARQAFGPEVEAQVRMVRPECPREWPRIRAAVRSVGAHFGRLTRYLDPAMHSLQTLRVVLGIAREKGADCATTRREVEAFVAERRKEFGSLAEAFQGLQGELAPDEAQQYSARLQAEVAPLADEMAAALQRLQAECPGDTTWFTALFAELVSGQTPPRSR